MLKNVTLLAAVLSFLAMVMRLLYVIEINLDHSILSRNVQTVFWFLYSIAIFAFFAVLWSQHGKDNPTG